MEINSRLIKLAYLQDREVKSRVSGIVCNCGAGFVIIPAGVGCTTSSRTSLRADACGGRKIVPECDCVIAQRDLRGNQ